MTVMDENTGIPASRGGSWKRAARFPHGFRWTGLPPRRAHGLEPTGARWRHSAEMPLPPQGQPLSGRILAGLIGFGRCDISAPTSLRPVSRGVLSFVFALLWLVSLAPGALAASTPPALTYNRARGEMDARIDGWTLRRLLDQMVLATGWQVYVEPGTQHPVSSSFRGLETREALRRLLGDLNFALVTPTNSPAKLFIYTTSVQQATQLIAGAAADGPRDASLLADELIVRLKPDGKESIEDLARRLGAKVVGRADELNAYRLKFEDADAAREARSALLNDPEVAAVDENYLINRLPGGESLQVPGRAVFNLSPTSRPDGSHFIVGVVDTAIQAQGTGLKDFLLSPIALAGDFTPGTTEPTHGTSMAETIMRGLMAGTPDGTTPVRLLPVDIYGANETTTSFDVARGIYAAIKGGATVINLSMGSSGDSGFLRDLIVQGDQQGILFVGAAGNEPTTAPTYPAAYPQVLAVTAGDRQGNIASYANRGDFIDVIAPGGGLIQFAGQSYYGVGTSFSTALVSGTAAGLGSSGTVTAAQLRQQILESLGRKTAP